MATCAMCGQSMRLEPGGQYFDHSCPPLSASGHTPMPTLHLDTTPPSREIEKRLEHVRADGQALCAMKHQHIPAHCGTGRDDTPVYHADSPALRDVVVDRTGTRSGMIAPDGPPAKCSYCQQMHYGSTPCPYKPKESGEARTVRVRIAVVVMADGSVSAAAHNLKSNLTDGRVMQIAGQFRSAAVSAQVFIEADIPITEPATIRAEVVQ